jgi:hypothetical protein
LNLKLDIQWNLVYKGNVETYTIKASLQTCFVRRCRVLFRLALTLGGAFLVVGVSGCMITPFQMWDDALKHGLPGPDPPARPTVISATEVLVEASGGMQSDGLSVENHAIVGEPFQTGLLSIGAVPAIEVRHGFAPPHMPMMPTGIAHADAGRHPSSMFDPAFQMYRGKAYAH